MKFRHPLPSVLIQRAASFVEFANGGAVCHARLTDGTIHPGLLISNSGAIVAMRGQDELPFDVADIDDLYQTANDCAPQNRRDWKFFDEWSA